MDGLPSQQPEPQVEIVKKSFLKTTLGKITISITAIILILVSLTALNYFNLITLPKQLNFLPKKQIQTATTKQSANYTPVTTISSLSSPEEKGVYQLAQSLVDTTLQPEYRKKLTLKEFIFSGGQKTVPFPTIVDSWAVSSVSAKLSLQYDFKKRRVLNIDLSLETPYTNSKISSLSVSKILSPYLRLDKFQLSCKEANAIGNIQCNSMITREDETRVGVSFMTNNKPSADNKTDIINICQAFAGSNTYTWNSCLHE